MTIERGNHAREKGIALLYVGVFLVPLLLCTGLAIDLGHGYLVRVALAKAVDGAALAAARSIAQGTDAAQSAARNIFDANFPEGFLGVTYVQRPPDGPDGMTIRVDPSNGSYVIRVPSRATLPTTFMRIAGRESLEVSVGATATRRLVDMSFVMDRSGSLNGVFPQVKEAAKTFVSQFDKDSDRVALITFSSGTTVPDPMQAARGFDPDRIKSDIDSTKAGGPTATAEALYEAWDQLRSVPSGAQSSLRIVVLFTDGTPNAFPGYFRNVAKSKSECGSPFDSATHRLLVPLFGTICSIDFPGVGNPTTWDTPYTVGLYDTYAARDKEVLPTHIDVNDQSGSAYMSTPSDYYQTVNPCIPYLPPKSTHTPKSSGIPRGFFLYVPPHQRPLIRDPDGSYPDHVLNANNAARNLAETIADAIRSDRSGPRIRIYTLGLGDLLNQRTGSALETGESILQRIANDLRSPDHNPDQLDGKYFFADTTDQLNAAFDAVRDEVYRLTQ